MPIFHLGLNYLCKYDFFSFIPLNYQTPPKHKSSMQHIYVASIIREKHTNGLCPL